MKRVIAFLLVCMMVIVAGACGTKEAAPTAEPSQVPSVVPSEDPTEAPVIDSTDEVSGNEEPTEEPTEEPSDEDGVKDMTESLAISLTYDANGAVSNGVAEGPQIAAYNNKTIATEKNAETGKWQSNLNGSTDFYMASLVDLYDYMEEAFTLEFCFKFTQAPASPYCGVIDNCEAGGFGFELHPGETETTAILKWNLYVDSDYILQDIPVNIDTWYHVVVTWDGCNSNIYINGELADSYDTMYGFIGFTQIETAKHLAIGACCSQGNSGGAGFVGAISLCNLYLDSVNDATAADLYSKL